MRHSPAVFRLALRLLGDREAAADASQEVFLRAQERLGSYQRGRSFRAWLCTISWNHCKDELRRRRLRTWLPAAGRSREAGDDAPEPVDTREPAPPDSAWMRERRELVERAFKELSPRERALLVFREYEALSHDEMAELFGCRVGSIKSGLHRARGRLKEALLRVAPQTRHEL